MDLKDKTYLIPKKGNDGSDLRKTSFAVSPGSLKAHAAPYKPHKALAENKLDKKNANKIRMNLISYLSKNNAYPSFYEEQGPFGKFLRNDAVFDEFFNDYRKNGQIADIGTYTVKLFVYDDIKKVGLDYINRSRKNNE